MGFNDMKIIHGIDIIIDETSHLKFISYLFIHKDLNPPDIFEAWISGSP